MLSFNNKNSGQSISRIDCTHAHKHARTHSDKYINVLGQLVEHGGRLQDHNRSLSEVQGKTSFIGNIVYGMIFWGHNYIMLHAMFQNKL